MSFAQLVLAIAPVFQSLILVWFVKVQSDWFVKVQSDWNHAQNDKTMIIKAIIDNFNRRLENLEGKKE